MKIHRVSFVLSAIVALAAGSVRADVKLPSIFTSHLVLQRDQANPVWGKADAGEEVTVTLGKQSHKAKADADGNWRVKLDPLSAGGPHEIVVEGKNKITLEDCLVGEVWLCSGQSNMEWNVSSAFDPDLEALTANYPQIRFVTVPHNGVQEPQWDFKGQWEVCTPQTVPNFSAVGYFFGRQLHQTLNVPIGLIDVSWGGSACEAWINRDVLTKDGRFSELIARWEGIEKAYDADKAKAQYEEALAKWKQDAEAAKKEGKQPPRPPQQPGSQLSGNARPGNIYNGSLKPIMGYGLRGNIWYQGESNAGRAYQYRDLFPLMIDSWRKEWGEGDFSFYWVQLADFLAEKNEPGESSWAELREAQTMTMSELPNTGEAVIIDLGEANDIHPRDKQNVAKRLARWALAKDYGLQIPYKSPTVKEMDVIDHRVQLTFDNPNATLKAFDYADVRGFAVAGEDKKWYWATAQIQPNSNKVLVSAPQVKKPVAVRYGWADNPVCNLRSTNGLPVTPFRTDDWEGVTAQAK